MTAPQRTGHAASVLPALPSRRRRDVQRERMSLVVSTLGGSEAASSRDLHRQFSDLLGDASPEAVWLALAVLDGELPDAETVIRTVRTIHLDGVAAAFEGHISGGWLSWLTEPRATRPVEVLRGGVLVDIEHTARTELATGIQRVARQTIQRWYGRSGVVLGAWTRDHRALRLLDRAEQERALTGEAPDHPTTLSRGVVVPWESTYVLPELASEPERNARLTAMARFARGRTGVIGFDCVPVTSAETVNVGVSGTFIGNLGAVRHVDRVAAISEAAAGEYRGWRHMLSAAGHEGPDITAVTLPAEATTPSASALAQARERFLVGTLPMVLSVGAHEPRKNHLAVLHAADVLWRAGHKFSLTFIGGNAWGSERFEAAVARLRSEGRPVESVTAVPDDQLWAAYHLARFLVFPSLNEGFGLPVAEALACGTPVVTSDFGSMREIAEGGGAVLVDPRDDRSLRDGMERLLTDDTLRDRLHQEALRRRPRSWEDYAGDLWDYLVGT